MFASDSVHDMLGDTPGHPRYQASISGIARNFDLLLETTKARHSHPTSGIVTYFVEADLDGRPLTDREVVEMCFTLVGGGVDSTASLTSSALVHLSRDRALRQRLIDEPDLITPATEEFLRLYPPLQHDGATGDRADLGPWLPHAVR